jgi:hypothetical protein
MKTPADTQVIEQIARKLKKDVLNPGLFIIKKRAKRAIQTPIIIKENPHEW